jgi:hypothetical protein
MRSELPNVDARAIKWALVALCLSMIKRRTLLQFKGTSDTNFNSTNDDRTSCNTVRLLQQQVHENCAHWWQLQDVVTKTWRI